MKKHIPNAVTCLNLLSGCIGIVYAFGGELKMASLAILIAAILDFLDGMLARLLKAYSDIGKELDSLADVVSFGVLPSVIIYHLALQNGPAVSWLPFSGFLIAIFSALRLAKFNVDTRQAENFIGLPTPANAMLIASFPFLLESSPLLEEYISNPWILAVFSLLIGLLLVSEIPLISLKFKSTDLKKNLLRYILVFSSLILIVLFKFAAVPLIIIFYFVISFIHFRSVQ